MAPSIGVAHLPGRALWLGQNVGSTRPNFKDEVGNCVYTWSWRPAFILKSLDHCALTVLKFKQTILDKRIKHNRWFSIFGTSGALGRDVDENFCLSQ